MCGQAGVPNFGDFHYWLMKSYVVDQLGCADGFVEAAVPTIGMLMVVGDAYFPSLVFGINY